MSGLGSFPQGSVVSRWPPVASPWEPLGLLRLGSSWGSRLGFLCLTASSSLESVSHGCQTPARVGLTGQPPRAWLGLEFGNGWAGGSGGSVGWGLRAASPVTQSEGSVPAGPADSHGVDGSTTLSLIFWLLLEGARTVLYVPMAGLASP